LWKENNKNKKKKEKRKEISPYNEKFVILIKKL